MHFFEDTHEHLYAHEERLYDERLHDERLFDMDDVEDVQEEEYLTYDEEMERFEQLTNDDRLDDDRLDDDRLDDDRLDDEPFSPEF